DDLALTDHPHRRIQSAQSAATTTNEALAQLRHPNTRTTGTRRTLINAPQHDPAGNGAARAALPLASTTSTTSTP
ncbi:hypothetical protein, partial [Salinispora arenicola]